MAQKQLTVPLPSILSPIARVEISFQGRKVSGEAFIVSPWNSFFQQFVQNPPAAIDIELDGSPFTITPNAHGILNISGGTVSAVTLTRGTTTITIAGDARAIIPVRISDMVTITYSVLPTVKFLPN